MASNVSKSVGFWTTFNGPVQVGTGGAITTVSEDRVHIFNSNGVFRIPFSGNTRLLTIAGGGGGGGTVAGGGGGGEFVEIASQALSRDTDYAVTIGLGGSGGIGWSTSQDGANGSNSSFGSLITARGGGGGASHQATGNNQGNGKSGGSGGGAGAFTSPRTGGTATAVSPGLGNAGGDRSSISTMQSSSGGGGAVDIGGAASANVGGNGGTGKMSNISGTITGYAGGGGGGGRGDSTAMNGAGSNTYGGGRGGRGTATPVVYNNTDAENIAIGTGVGAMDARTNSGSGGGGAGYNGTSGSRMGGNGGSGIAIVRYNLPSNGKWLWTSTEAFSSAA
ncbi:MAG: glycine-rich domain-containing protein [Desulfitobacteriaceae bacterium]